MLSDEFEEVSLFDENKPVCDTDQLPMDGNVATTDRSGCA
jgi:hypothetical protein